jgi:hypothetical protein
VYNPRYHPSPIPKGRLEILLLVSFRIADENRRYLYRLIELVENNYDASEQAKENEDENIDFQA